MFVPVLSASVPLHAKLPQICRDTFPPSEVRLPKATRDLLPKGPGQRGTRTRGNLGILVHASTSKPHSWESYPGVNTKRIKPTFNLGPGSHAEL